MTPIQTTSSAKKLSQSLTDSKITLVGGCFDILHIGHIQFLEKAKKLGDVLVVLLESDSRVTELKGEGRPVNSQPDRATLLSALKAVDYVILLPEMKSEDYDKLVLDLKPKFIAVTAGDRGISFKQRSANLVGAKVVSVVGTIPDKSTSKVLQVILKRSAGK